MASLRRVDTQLSRKNVRIVGAAIHTKVRTAIAPKTHTMKDPSAVTNSVRSPPPASTTHHQEDPKGTNQSLRDAPSAASSKSFVSFCGAQKR